VRVADFGLARALAEASWTEPAGTVVGTARYAAPEQATGAPLDGRADLYSLAVVHGGGGHRHGAAVADTAIGTLAARTHTPLVAPLAPRSPGPGGRARRSPGAADRYPDAATMRAALGDAARALPASAAASPRRARG
jgi:serine/threonine-protein kinase